MYDEVQYKMYEITIKLVAFVTMVLRYNVR